MPYYFTDQSEEAELNQLVERLPDVEVRYRTPMNGRDGWYYRRRIESCDEWYPWWGGTNLSAAFATKESALEAAGVTTHRDETGTVSYTDQRALARTEEG